MSKQVRVCILYLFIAIVSISVTPNNFVEQDTQSSYKDNAIAMQSNSNDTTVQVVSISLRKEQDLLIRYIGTKGKVWNNLANYTVNNYIRTILC